jgi:hypothetical protein
MRSFLAIIFGVAMALVLLLWFHYRTENYKKVYSVFIVATNLNTLSTNATICYSNEQLRRTVQDSELLEKAGIAAFDFDKTNLFVCIVGGCTVERVVARQDMGMVLLRRSSANGISFTVFQGKKRFFQFTTPRDP